MQMQLKCSDINKNSVGKSLYKGQNSKFYYLEFSLEENFMSNMCYEKKNPLKNISLPLSLALTQKNVIQVLNTSSRIIHYIFVDWKQNNNSQVSEEMDEDENTFQENQFNEHRFLFSQAKEIQYPSKSTDKNADSYSFIDDLENSMKNAFDDSNFLIIT